MRMIPPTRSLPAAALAVAAAACTSAGRGPAPATGYTAALVDSVAWTTEMDEGFLRRVEVRGRGRVDTIPGLLTKAVPVAVGGGVLGIEYSHSDAAALFRYDAAARQVERFRLPADVNPYFGMPAVSPDGRHLAYVEVPGDATARGVVRLWPDGAVVLRTDPVRVPETDATGNRVKWLDGNRVRFLIDHPDNGWWVAEASVRERSSTVRPEPVTEVPPR